MAHAEEPIESDAVAADADATGQLALHAGVPTLSVSVKPGHVPKLDLKVANEVSFRDDVQVETVPADMHGGIQSSTSKDRWD